MRVIAVGDVHGCFRQMTIKSTEAAEVRWFLVRVVRGGFVVCNVIRRNEQVRFCTDVRCAACLRHVDGVPIALQSVGAS